MTFLIRSLNIEGDNHDTDNELGFDDEEGDYGPDDEEDMRNSNDEQESYGPDDEQDMRNVNGQTANVSHPFARRSTRTCKIHVIVHSNSLFCMLRG